MLRCLYDKFAVTRAFNQCRGRANMNQRELLLARHAKSDWNTDAKSDFDRPLSKRGKRDAPRMGEWLQSRELIPDYIVSSPSRRTRRTAEAICEILSMDSKSIAWEPGMYEADLNTLLAVLASCPPNKQRILLIGHNPGLEELLIYLLDSVPDTGTGKLFPTAAIARLQMPQAWLALKRGEARLLELKTPPAVE
jgi:phosphohistidine phosphatase